MMERFGLDANIGSKKNIFLDNSSCKLEARRSNAFWHTKLMREQTLKEAYPKVYEETENPFISVVEGGVRNGSLT